MASEESCKDPRNEDEAFCLIERLKKPVHEAYKRLIVESAPFIWNESASIRDAHIRNWLMRASMAAGGGWMVCVILNSKNRMGGYTGMGGTLILFTNDRISAHISSDSCLRGASSLLPFPELNGK